ncbi:LemA family protein [Candidatus Uhrbacteria bacterium]|nr:LemA family protein [Candidatus Uhrbacteria bacterium]
MPTYLWIIIAVVVLVLLWLIGAYNSLVSRRRRVDEAWADIDTQLKRRYDLIPNLMETIRGYAKHEAGIFERVTKARSEAMSAQGPAEHGRTENMLTETLKSLFAVAENYPDLKASANFIQMQDELSDTENKIQAARRFYNGNVRDYNTVTEQFPTNLVAGPFGFKERQFFELTEESEREAPKVKF